MPGRYNPGVTIAQSFKAVRKDVLGLTQRELSERTHIPQDQIARYEKNRAPGAEALRKLRAGTGVPADQWIGLETATPRPPSSVLPTAPCAGS